MKPDVLKEGTPAGWVFIHPGQSFRPNVNNVAILDSVDDEGTVYSTVTFFVCDVAMGLIKEERNSPFTNCIPVQLKDLKEYASLLVELSNTGVRHVYFQYVPRDGTGPKPTPIADAIAEVRNQFR